MEGRSQNLLILNKKNAIVDFNVSDKEEIMKTVEVKQLKLLKDLIKNQMTNGLNLVTLTFQTKVTAAAVAQNQKKNPLQGLQQHKTLQEVLKITSGGEKNNHVVFIRHSKENIFLLHHQILYHLISILKSFLMPILLNTLHSKQIYTQFKLVVNR